MPETKPALIFTLVHGTFAKGSRWVTDDSDEAQFRSRLRKALKADFDVTFDDTFDWGYSSYKRPWDNTMSARTRGSIKLIDYLKKLPDAGEARRFLVAHSHGGNVALHALKDETARKKVDGLICLATPCLFFKMAPFRRDLLGFSAAVLAVATFGWAPRLPTALATGLWIYTIIYVLMVALIIIAPRTDIDSIASHLKQFDVPRLPGVWFMRVPEDEVGSLMATAILMAMVILRLSFAFDSIRLVPDWDTWSKPVPWDGEKVELVKLDPRTRGLLRHTKIQGPSAARIAELVRTRDTLPAHAAPARRATRPL